MGYRLSQNGDRSKDYRKHCQCSREHSLEKLDTTPAIAASAEPLNSAQYTGKSGSISAAQAATPPDKFHTSWKPFALVNAVAQALRIP